jgi:hypothetical protein
MLSAKSLDALKSDLKTMSPEATKSDFPSNLPETVDRNVEPSSPDGPVLELGTMSSEFINGSVFAALSDRSIFDVKPNPSEHVRSDADESSSERTK